MSATPVIRIGGSLPFCFDRSDLSLSDWVLTITVKDFPSDSTSQITAREIERVGTAWPGFLTSTETASFGVTSELPKFLIGNLVNLSTDEQQTIPLRFRVVPAWT